MYRRRAAYDDRSGCAPSATPKQEVHQLNVAIAELASDSEIARRIDTLIDAQAAPGLRAARHDFPLKRPVGYSWVQLLPRAPENQNRSTDRHLVAVSG